MNPLLYGAGIGVLIAALGVSVGAIAATIWPARAKIIAALRGRGL
jgi:hypothetical protein